MNIRYVRYFLAVAEHQGFTRAAEALHISQPALSQQIRMLEESLDAQLFDRSGRHIHLTDAGEVFLQYARQAFQLLDEGQRAIHDVEDLSRGSLRIAVTPTFTSYFVVPLVAEFHARYPHITLDIQEMSQEKMEGLLLENELDIGIAFAGGTAPDIVSTPLLQEVLALVVAAHHPLAREESLTLSQLAAEEFILLNHHFATRLQIDHCLQRAGFHPQVTIEMHSINAILDIIQRTQLVTILPLNVAAQRTGLVTRLLEEATLERTAVLMQRKGARQKAAARIFAEMAQQLAARIES
ncbi:TPA: transcriptional regulator CynR [Klebsiella aerogenes]|uniref:Transcriptional regulator CynR n=1 Tax=Klebsiella aerogenes TaxID=548 RepID=A0AAP9U3T1_KLEAE|nr:transcriptional regulator CynR [Klebsiella aerogenes]EKM7810894.1 transcriptional regulator CynR [Klebsiella aerogenes]EKU4514819.1 transcriptional regulator CynR [Klebsiella aerogenes]EKU6674704.1 transcriptional regulator CynR [Klebsiella aerogenes]EKU7552548.1 transcriptional regulator CynR [Klebsiella aerogenes]EKX4409041.1 transcriptional regulator CynR [Klebsiella aerogenes]